MLSLRKRGARKCKGVLVHAKPISYTSFCSMLGCMVGLICFVLFSRYEEKKVGRHK